MTVHGSQVSKFPDCRYIKRSHWCALKADVDCAFKRTSI